MANRPHQISTAVLAALISITGLSSCSTDDFQPVDHPTLLVAPEPETGGGQVDSAWGGTIDATQECVTVVSGEHRALLVAPADSALMQSASTGELALRIDGQHYPLDAEYKGGGVSLEIGADEAPEFPGAHDCAVATGTSTMVFVYSIEPA